MREGSWRFRAVGGADMYGLSPAWQYDETKELRAKSNTQELRAENNMQELRAILKNMQEKLEKPAVSESAEV